jgi:uncharacterized phage infection (PIP) family protein YhgE
MTTTVSPKLAESTAVNEAVKARMAPKQAAQAAPIDITANPVAKIVFNPEAAPEARSRQIAALLSPEFAEECKASIKQLEAYKEYLAQQRTLMQRRLIELSSTTVFSKMKQTFGDMNKGVLDFREMIRPLVDNLDALYTLRTAGDNVVLDTFAEIEEDRKREADWDRRTSDADSEIRRISSDKQMLERDIAKLKTQTGMFGGIKRSAQAEIAAKELLIARGVDGLKACREKVVAIVAEKAEHDAKEGKFKAEKDQVRAMLDISGPEHVKRVEGIIKAALDYIDKSQVTVSELRDELGGIEGQADKLVKINSQMITVVAILDKGIDLATTTNKDKVQALSTGREGEDTLARLERERSKNDFERHVTALLDSGRSTKKTVADLEKDAVSASTFHDALGKQNVNLRELSSDGIASVATSLNTTIQALNNSALNEASESVRDSMRAMNAVTDDVANKEVIRQALQLDDTSRQIVEKIESMSSIAESLQAANKLREDGLSNIQSRLGELNDVTAAVRARLQESIGMDAKGPGASAAAAAPAPVDDKEITFGQI